MRFTFKLFVLLYLFSMLSCSGNNDLSSGYNEVSIIETNTESLLSKVFNINDVAFLNLGDYSNSVRVPKKVLKWGDYIVYQSLEPNNMGQGNLLILNSNLEVVKEMKPSSSAPGEFKELTDFFIWEDYLYIYDFQSQKFMVFDKKLNAYREVRSGFYFYNIVATESMIVAYANKKIQFVENVKYPYDIMILDEELKPKKYLRKIDESQITGTVLNSDRSLISGSDEVYFTPFWSDSMHQILPDKMVSSFVFEYQNPLPEGVKRLGHVELLQGIMGNKYSAYEKGASPTFVSKSQILFSFGSEDRLKYGVYDRSKGSSIVFDDYRYSLGEQLLRPQYLDNGLYVSFMYPYELRGYLNSGLINEASLESYFYLNLKRKSRMAG